MCFIMTIYVETSYRIDTRFSILWTRKGISVVRQNFYGQKTYTIVSLSRYHTVYIVNEI